MNIEKVPVPKPLKVLVVDDTATNRMILQVFLKKLKLTVVTADDGVQGVAAFVREAPDLVIMDVMMPVMDGFEATRQIKALAGERWVPVIFLSALDKEENLVAGLDAGGDDYLHKPVNFVILEAKMRSLARALATQTALDENAKRLQIYHDQQEAESTLALKIVGRQMQRSGLQDPQVQHWLSPAANFSGDVVAARRGPKGNLYAMLGDATGHGLGAAICTLPVLTLFYGLSESGFELPRMIYEINSQLCGTLPVGYFVGATFLCISTDGTRAEIWGGGTPDVLLLGEDGKVKRRIPPAFIPLGIDQLTLDEIKVEEIALLPADQFILFSDGLPEAANAEGVDFGYDHLFAALSGAPASKRVNAVKDALTLHMGEILPHDDVSILAISATAG